MYYGILGICAAMFGTQFLFTKMFRDAYGNDFKAMCVSSAGSAIVGIILLSILNGFSFGCTAFSLIMALTVAINGKLFTLCSLKALGKINLSLYSVFSMIGGMALPFLAGILFFNEPLTAGKTVCFLFITAAVIATFKGGNLKGGTILYIGVFVFNGMSGVLSKIYTALSFEKVSASEYSILCALVNLILSCILLLFIRGNKRQLTAKAIISIIGTGVLNRMANYLLLICLIFVPASAQYPIITGGTMIVSTIISSLISQKPSKNEILSVILSFIGLLMLAIIP